VTLFLFCLSYLLSVTFLSPPLSGISSVCLSLSLCHLIGSLFWRICFPHSVEKPSSHGALCDRAVQLVKCIILLARAKEAGSIASGKHPDIDVCVCVCVFSNHLTINSRKSKPKGQTTDASRSLSSLKILLEDIKSSPSGGNGGGARQVVSLPPERVFSSILSFHTTWSLTLFSETGWTPTPWLCRLPTTHSVWISSFSVFYFLVFVYLMLLCCPFSIFWHQNQSICFISHLSSLLSPLSVCISLCVCLYLSSRLSHVIVLPILYHLTPKSILMFHLSHR